MSSDHEPPRGITRRSFLNRASVLFGSLAGTSATVAGFGAAAAGGDEIPNPVTASSLATVSAVSPDGTLTLETVSDSRRVEVNDPAAAADQLGQGLLAQPDGSEETVRDPVPLETWKPGQEAVLIEKFENGAWIITDVERLYRPIDGVAITDRRGSTLVTDSANLQLTPESEPRASEGGYVAEPVSDIATGARIGGLGFYNPVGSDSQDCWLDVSQVGVRSRGG